nr:hypothetical protein [Candidatus Cloacimonadota bacterium]
NTITFPNKIWEREDKRVDKSGFTQFLTTNFIFRFLILFFLLFEISSISALTEDAGDSDKKFDLVNYHNVGNIWLRVSNYGFFGSGYAISPQWPSLEYPGGSAIDYLFQGSLWFGAKKVRRNSIGEKLYWLPHPEDENDVVSESSSDWTPQLSVVVDTLVTVGYDGRWDVYEFLPAYNPLETAPLGDQFDQNNPYDKIMSASIRHQRKGIDDDGDGKIDEDPVGYAFPFRDDEELPVEFSSYGNSYLTDVDDFSYIEKNPDIWFPLGFIDLSDESNEFYNFAEETDDDSDGLFDEDGYPVSEQDYISYYYDYSPFGTAGQRDWGGAKSGNTHFPLNIRVRQMSYQWSYEHIKNLVYVEFDITNMNRVDTLYDCVMGIYMDSDVGPQAWSGADRANDDVSSYVAGEGYEFAYTFDADGDQGLSTGFVGSRVCTPDPDLLDFSCWYWEHGNGPKDGNALNLNPTGLTANEKYWLLSGRNPDDGIYVSLLDGAISPIADTRYLFGFYGDMMGWNNPSSSSWNLAPGKTMKIVIALFPGDTIHDLKSQSVWAKLIYGQAQDLETVTLPDTFVHYVGPEPPAVPKMYAELSCNGNAIDVYWDNRSEIDNIDYITVTNEQIGWQDQVAGIDSYSINADTTGMPEEFKPENWNGGISNENALINPWTGYRLRHDFQGYSVWGRSGSGSHEYWILQDRWDKIDTEQDREDYQINSDTEYFYDFGGDEVIDEGLPNRQNEIGEDDLNYYHLNDFYALENYDYDDIAYGKPIYDHQTVYSDSLQNFSDNLSFDEQSLLFKHPDLRDDIYLNIYDDRLIPLNFHGGQSYLENGTELEEHRINRLSRRFYSYRIKNPRKGIEYYVTVTAWDRGMPEKGLQALESGRDIDANMKVIFPGPAAKSQMEKIHVVPNPYIGQSKFDGRREKDEKGDKSRRLWFVDIPEYCTIKIFTLAGDLVDTINHNGETEEDIISISKAAYTGVAANGIASWNLLSRHNQIIAPGIYLFSVKNKENGEIKVGKFVVIK